MPASDFTIAAIATPPGEGGVGIVRLSGSEAVHIARRLFQPSRAAARLRSHHMVHGTIRDPASNAVIDQCLACLMVGPRSYTGEDVVEFHCHGSPAVLQRVLSCCLAAGAQLANRGEFTQRAFLNGKLDLAQAEAVLDLVRARTPIAAQVAAQGVTGALAQRIEPLSQGIIGALAYLEATIDFSEEDLPEQAAPRLVAIIEAALADLTALLRRASHGALLREGVRVVLAGKPNVGKSSLLNALLRRDRAIVSAIAGTTRDTLEEAANIHGLPMFLIDTAGLTDTDDPVEQLGIGRSAAALRQAGIVLLVVDASAPPDKQDQQAATAVRAAAAMTPTILVRNKCDLAPAYETEAFAELASPHWQPLEQLACSTVTGAGIATLEDVLARVALGGEELNAEETVVESARQHQALEEAARALTDAIEGLRGGLPSELVCIDLREALDALGAVTGLNVGEAVLDRIFRDFCIGK